MKRKITFLIAVVMLLTMISQPTRSLGQVSSAAPSDGASYVVAAYVGSKYYALPNGTVGGSTITGTEISLNALNMVNTSVASGKTWTLEEGSGGNTGQYYIKYTSGSDTYYLYKNGTGSSNHNFAVNKTSKNYWSFTTNGTGYTVAAIGRGTNHVNIKCASGTFSCDNSATPIILLEIGDVHTITYSAENGSISGLLYNTSTAVASGASIVEGGKVTLTATPASGYTFSSWEVSGTGSTLSSTTTNPTTFTMGTANTTVTAVFTASSTPTVTVTPNTLTDFNYINGSASPSEYQSFTVNGANLSDGVTVAVDASYTDNYAICKTADGTYTSSISLTESEVEAVGGITIYVHLKTGLSAGTYNNNTITAKYDADANVKATVTVSGYVTDTHTLTISATNGVIKNGDDTMATGTVAEGAEIEVTAVPNTGYKFTGWTVSGTGSNIGSDTDNPTTFTMGTADATLTAAFEVDPIVKTYLTGDDMEDVTNAGTSYGDSNMKSVTTSDGFYWESNGYQYQNPKDPDDKITDMLQLRKRDHESGVSYIKLPEFNGKIESIVFSVTDAANGSTTYANGGACKAIVCFQTGTTSGETPVTSAGNTSSGVKTITLDLSEKYYSTGYITLGTNSAGARFWNIEVNYIPYSNFTEWTPGNSFAAGGTYAVTTNINTADVTIPATAGLVVLSDKTLTVTGTLTNNGTAANLVIEDGGQLIASNSVTATYVKNIRAYSKGAAWYAISSPMHTDGEDDYIEYGDVENLTYTDDDLYDLFWYKESTHEWKNFKVADFNLYRGKGYLYRNGTGDELSFAGETNSGEFTIGVDYNAEGNIAALNGINLLGNPYPHNITLKCTSLQDNDYNDLADANQLTGCYVLSNEGAWSTQLGATDNIAPGRGFLVQVPASAKYINFQEEAQRNRSNGDYIKFVVANSQYEDVAYAVLDKGLGLKKIDHRNAEIPMIYINNNNADYAIATMNDDIQAINLNFKAMTIGQYTLSCKTNGEFSYLHIIDRLTGEDVDMLLEGEYSFIGAPTDSYNRFIVKLAYECGNNTNDNEIFAYPNGNDIVVDGNGELQIFDVTGRMVQNMNVNGVETISVQSQGVYIFRLIGNDVKTQKIVVR